MSVKGEIVKAVLDDKGKVINQTRDIDSDDKTVTYFNTNGFGVDSWLYEKSAPDWGYYLYIEVSNRSCYKVQDESLMECFENWHVVRNQVYNWRRNLDKWTRNCTQRVLEEGIQKNFTHTVYTDGKVPVFLTFGSENVLPLADSHQIFTLTVVATSDNYFVPSPPGFCSTNRFINYFILDRMICHQIHQ
eukprot:TRINITY_DN354_c0_g2_i2.p1 TRINITY_DN354_c0_g2~~TRINITY_DN354_c0_g2_i2.p1  ORF type:complete len:189 (+),score=21.95 TRINITY_DN354_c0_g2_i2:273-839(+)